MAKGVVLFLSGSELQVPFSGKRSRGPEETDCMGGGVYIGGVWRLVGAGVLFISGNLADSL